jgi:signal transduction histidine kinase
VEAEVPDARLRQSTFIGDELRIQQIMANFCWNSVKFTNKGGSVRISVEGQAGTEPDTMRLFLKVSDPMQPHISALPHSTIFCYTH